MEMHQIRYVLAIAETLSFTKAAAKCNVSQPALTKAVSSLEASLGTPLFHRRGRQIQLSEFGRSVLPHLQSIVDQTRTTRMLADNFRLLRNAPLRLGIVPTVGQARFASLLAQFQHDHDGVEVTVSEAAVDELKRRLLADELDLAVLNPLDGLGDDFTVGDLYSEQYVVVFPPNHPLAGQQAVALQDLNGEAYVDRLACEMREMVMEVCGQREIALYARFRSEREDWVQAMVSAGIGFAFMPEHSITLPDLVCCPLVEPCVARTIALASVPGRRFNPAVAALVGAARTYDWSR